MITVRNLQRRHSLKLAELRKFAERALALCQSDLPNELSEGLEVLLISDARMTELHQRFMQINEPTDVLTFQHGEIFISVETAAANARRFRTTFEKEIKLYLVHGLLHLCGHDDTTPASARRMKKAQARLLHAALRTV